MPFHHSTSSLPCQAGSVHTQPERALHSEPQGDQGRLGDSMPPLTTPRLCCQLERDSPSSLALRFCTHSAIYSLWQHSNHKAASAFYNRHRVPAHTHRAGPPAEEAPPSQPTRPSLSRAASEPCGEPPPRRLGKGLTLPLSTSQPNRQPPKEAGIQASVSPAGSPYVPRGLHLGRKMPPVLP